MFYIYGNETSQGDFKMGSIYKMNPNSTWANHYYNRKVLEHISRATKDYAEKHQAEKEIAIADRKMAFWERIHPDFDLENARSIVKKRYGM